MARMRDILVVAISVVLSLSMLVSPLWGSSAIGAGTVVFADRAHVDAANASVGSTVFDGDKLDTEQLGSLQVRAGAARLLLSASSSLKWGTEQGAPAATLTGGTAIFSTANAKAFALHVNSALIRPESNEATIGNVTWLNPKELIVRCTRGSLAVSVEDDMRIVPEGMAYHIVLDPNAERAAAEPPAPAGPGGQNGPVKAGRSRFIWYAIAITAIATGIALHYALESPDHP